VVARNLKRSKVELSSLDVTSQLVPHRERNPSLLCRRILFSDTLSICLLEPHETKCKCGQTVTYIKSYSERCVQLWPALKLWTPDVPWAEKLTCIMLALPFTVRYCAVFLPYDQLIIHILSCLIHHIDKVKWDESKQFANFWTAIWIKLFKA